MQHVLSMSTNIQVVGIKNIQLPIRVREKGGGLQNTVGTVSLQVSMPGEHRGSCITVFTAALNKYMDAISITNFSKLLKEVKETLNAESAKLIMDFPYFIEKKAPITGTRSLMEYRCTFTDGTGAETGADCARVSSSSATASAISAVEAEGAGAAGAPYDVDTCSARSSAVKMPRPARFS